MNAFTLIANKERRALLQNQRGLAWLLAYSGILPVALGAPLLIGGLLGFQRYRRWHKAS